jgi:hypothetical protein
MQIRGVGSARVYRPVHTPAVTSAEGGLVSPARTDVREHDVQVDLGAGSVERVNFSPPRPTGLNVFSNVAPSSAGAGAGRQSQGQGRQGSRNQGSTIVVTDQSGNTHELDMAKPGRVRIGGLMFETGGAAPAEKPRSPLGRLIDEAKKWLSF